MKNYLLTVAAMAVLVGCGNRTTRTEYPATADKPAMTCVHVVTRVAIFFSSDVNNCAPAKGAT